ncbi:hypothetical protein EDC04DRAFT_2607343 [Pisolithus marmoratus]|nr:hypothetical protein EDC04DRAFT_2607343 [Pisolithus marmoratus]
MKHDNVKGQNYTHYEDWQSRIRIHFCHGVLSTEQERVAAGKGGHSPGNKHSLDILPELSQLLGKAATLTADDEKHKYLLAGSQHVLKFIVFYTIWLNPVFMWCYIDQLILVLSGCPEQSQVLIGKV